MDFAVGVGLESTLDILITFPGTESFEKFVQEYQGELSPYLKRGYKTISRGSGGGRAHRWYGGRGGGFIGIGEENGGGN